MNQNFATIFQDVRHERSPILLLGLVEPGILRQSKVTDHEIGFTKDLASKNTQTTNIKRGSGYCFT